MERALWQISLLLQLPGWLPQCSKGLVQHFRKRIWRQKCMCLCPRRRLCCILHVPVQLLVQHG